MNAPKQLCWLGLTLLILTSSGWYFTHLKKITLLDKETLTTTIDTTVSKLTVRQFDTKGVLINLLKTPLMQHIPKDDLTLLQTPHIIISQDNKPSWEIRSVKAKSFNGGKTITFINQVVVHQKPDEKNPESTLKTEEVTYYPKEKKATTDLPVTFEQPGNVIQSTGMNAYLDEKRVELLHQARGSYAPSTNG
ncbi:MAG: LPS export ABC transporter periplasmic protein LptC [Legionellales bacterium]